MSARCPLIPRADIPLRFAQQLWKLGDVGGDAAGFVPPMRRENGPDCPGQGRRYLLSVLLSGFGNRWTGRRKVLRIHDRPERDLGVERKKPRLGDPRNLRCVFQVEHHRAGPITVCLLYTSDHLSLHVG